MTETHVSLSHVNICSEINPETYVGGIMPSILYQLSGSQENFHQLNFRTVATEAKQSLKREVLRAREMKTVP